MSSTIDVRAPSEQSEGTRSQLQRWLKTVGETVAQDEPLIEVETDKVTIEIPSPAAGVLQEILKQEQEDIEPGELLARIGVGMTQAKDFGEMAEPMAVRAPINHVANRGAHSTAVDTATDVGPLLARRLSPAVRRLLEQHGLEPGAVRGTGEGGRISVDDVLAHVAAGERGAWHKPASNDAAMTPESPVIPSGPPVGPTERLLPNSPMRRRIAQRMVESLLHTAPHVTTVFEADLTEVLAHRARHREEFSQRGAALTLTAYILAACVDAIREVPEVNSRWTDAAIEIYDNIDIGVGTALEGKGLIVPVVRNVQSLDLFAIASQLGALVSRARDNTLTPEDVRGGTFTISNHGVSGSVMAAPIIINQPQSAILGVGKVEQRAVVMTEGGEHRIVARPRCYITLTIDHRVMDGHRANRFLEVLVKRLEEWRD